MTGNETVSAGESTKVASTDDLFERVVEVVSGEGARIVESAADAVESGIRIQPGERARIRPKKGRPVYVKADGSAVDIETWVSRGEKALRSLGELVEDELEVSIEDRTRTNPRGLRQAVTNREFVGEENDVQTENTTHNSVQPDVQTSSTLWTNNTGERRIVEFIGMVWFQGGDAVPTDMQLRITADVDGDGVSEFFLGSPDGKFDFEPGLPVDDGGNVQYTIIHNAAIFADIELSLMHRGVPRS